jgi:eukaryotic-like serine/threonine-protein kinase
MPDLTPDTLVDERYKILTRIGSGGMAEVFCAFDESLGRKVALKLLHRRFAEDREFVERFRREASSAAGLQHPNVVGIYDRGRWDGTYYIAMEYLPGRTLKDLVVHEAPLDPVRSIDLTLQILKAARFAHRRGIVHRDLKPHNVIVDDEDRAKVADFGIARAGASDMTETGSIMGTAQYLSPEQAQGFAVNGQSDLYSIGVILYELLTGHVPFEAESTVTIALKHVSEAPAPPTTFVPGIPPELEAIVLWALEKDPANRPADADAFIHALEQVRWQLTGAESPGQRTAQFAAAGAGAGYAAGRWATGAFDVPGPPDEPAEEEPRRRPPWWVWALVVLALVGAGAAAWALTRPGEVVVANVVGREYQAASARLERDGLDVRVRRVFSARPIDEVVAQSPRARRTVQEGSTVTLSVSRGPGTIDVPAVDGLSIAKAQATLQNAGLAVGETPRESSDTVDSGLVTRTSPPAGADVRRGSKVNVYVSSGPALVTVPNVVGRTRSDAEGELDDAGFASTVTEQESGDVTPGQVISQDPGGDSSAAPGSTVALVVARAPPQVSVPDVIGQGADDAVAALEGAGLEARQSPVDVTDPAQDGVVIAQRPTAGTRADDGAPVRIQVGRYTEPTTPTTPTTPDESTPGAPAPDQFGFNGGGRGRARGRRAG